MPIYDITRILDSAAAFDMAMHARYWTYPGLEGLRIPAALANHLRLIDLSTVYQQQYMARALYSHCARYVTGMPRIRAPPVDHLGTTKVVPDEQFYALAAAAMAHDASMRRTLQCWLTNVLVHGSARSTALQVRYSAPAVHSGRRRLRHSARDGFDAEKVQAATNEALAAISRHHHTLPRMRCIVSPAGPGKVTIGLFAHPRAPCDE